MLGIYILLFAVSCALLYFSGGWVIRGLMGMARFLGWREFVMAFFVMAFAASIPNLFVGISSALHRIPQLSFGEIVGGSVVDLTIAVALAALIAKGLPAKSLTLQTSVLFTIAIAILPLILILDGILNWGDGIVLILAFCVYVFWLFSKQKRYTKVYDTAKIPIIKKFKIFIKDLARATLGIFLLLLAAEGIVRSAAFFAKDLNLPLALVGILIVGLGNTLPEAYFAVTSARKGQTGLILGDLMGAVIIPATLVLGIVAIICPIVITDFSPFAMGRFFLLISAFFFLVFIRTGRKITFREALLLLGIYIAFVLAEILI